MGSRAGGTEYGELLFRKQPRVIRSDRENAMAMRNVEELMRRDERLTPAERDLLELLAVLIEGYEERRYPPVRARRNEWS
jgi:antitoxin component HigA of HigAB toxin-antitoxin module